jgi:hypothetical protein
MKLRLDLSKQFAKGNEMLISEAINYALADYFSRFEKEYKKLDIDQLKHVKRGIRDESRVKKVLGNLRNLKRHWTT